MNSNCNIAYNSCNNYIQSEKNVAHETDVTITTGYPQPTRAEILEKIKGAHGVLWATYDRLDAEALDAAGPQLKSISVMSAGLDYIDIPEVRRRNINLGYTPILLNDAVADVAIGLAIAASRRFHEGRLNINENKWEIRPQYLLGQDIKSSTIGIVGFGGIGQTIAKRLKGFDVGSILYSGHKAKPEGEELGAKFVQFDELLAKSDYVFLSAPLTNETRGLFNEATFNKMKPTSVLINVARGGIVDQTALYNALKNGTIFAAGIDVMTPEPLPPNDPLTTLPNIIIVPHIGSATVRTRNDMAVIAAHNVLRGLVDAPMLSPVP